MAAPAFASPIETPKDTSTGGYPDATLIHDIPTPSRAKQQPLPEMQQTCLLDICPWDSLAQCLTLPELEWVCCASTSLRRQLTIEEVVEQDSEADDAAETPKCKTCRKLLAPLLVLKIETAEIELQRVSLTNVRAIRVWNYRSLDFLQETMAATGGPQVLRSLERIMLKGCPLIPEMLDSFLVPVFSHASMKHINLEKNQVTDENLCDLINSGALDAGTLESINLRFNRIGSKGAQALAASKCSKGLKWVNLKMNQVGDDGATALAEMLHGNTTMSLLNLRRQTPALTDRSAFAFAEMLKNNSALEQLRLRQNRICDDGAKALAEQVPGHVQRLQCFRGVGARFELDLESNRIKESGASALLESLEGVSKAVRVELLIHGNFIKQADFEKVYAEKAAEKRLTFDSKPEGLLW